MFSSRLESLTPPNPLALACARMRDRGESFFDLTVSNPTRAGLCLPSSQLASLAHPAGTSYSPDPRGLITARQAIAAYLLRQSQVAIPLEQLFLTASTSEAYSHLFKLLGDPGDQVLVPQPSYPLFEHLLRLEALEPVPYPLRYDGTWHLDPGELSQHLTARTRAILVVNPNNPTGHYLKERELTGLFELCRTFELALISDEVFADFPLEQSSPGDPRIPWVASRARGGGVLTFSLSGLSKVLGLPQLKLAWILADGPPNQLEQALERLEIISDTYLSVGTPVQLALPALLEAREELQRPILHRILANRLELVRQFRALPEVSVLRTEGGWSQVLRIPQLLPESELVLELLERERVLVHPGYFYDFEREGTLVVNLLGEPGDYREGLTRLVRGLARQIEPLREGRSPDPRQAAADDREGV